MELPETFLHVAERLGWVFVHSLWQGALIGVVLALALALFRHRSAAIRHAACLAAFSLLAAAAVVTAFALGKSAPPGNSGLLGDAPERANVVEPADSFGPSLAAVRAASPQAASSDFHTPALAAAPAVGRPGFRERIRPWLPSLACIWCGGVLLLSIRHAGGWLRIRRWRREGEMVPRELDVIFRELRDRFQIPSGVILRRSTRAVAPMLTGILKPIILLPAQVVSGLTPAELRAILAHELAHLARRDSWSNLFQIVIETLFFYHPLVWWISRRARAEREVAADDLALGVCADRRIYAGALVRLAEIQCAPACAVAANGGSLAQRIRRILAKPPREPVSFSWLVPGAVTASLVLGALVFGAMAQDAPVVEVKPGESIQKAIEGAEPGSVIRIAAGRWNERLTIAKPLTLEGAGWDKTILQPDRHDPEKAKVRKALEESANANRAGGREASAPKPEDAFEPTITIANTSGVMIRRLGIKGLSFPGRDVKNGLYPDPLVSLEKARATISECVIAGYYRGVSINAESSAKLQGTLIAAMWSEGVSVATGGQLHFVESEARNCRYAGIRIGRRCDDSLVERSRISGAAWHGLRYDHASPTIRGNVFFNNARTDIYASGESQAAILNNLFLSGGVWCLGDNRSTIQGNTFAGSEASLSVSHGAQLAVTKNVFANQEKAITYFPPAGWAEAAGPEVFVKLADNFFWKTETAFEIGNQPQPFPPGNQQTDPQFADPAAGNFRLAGASSALQAEAGARDPLSPASPWGLLPEEAAMIPEGETRETQFWKYPGSTATPRKATEDRRQAAFQTGTAWVKDALQLEDANKRRAAIDAIHKAIDSADNEAIRAGLSAFARIGQVAFDKTAFRPPLRKLLQHPEPDIRASACGALAATGANKEDVDLVIPLTEDESGEVKKAAVWALKWLSGADFTGEVGRAVQKVVEAAGPDLRKELWGTMWGTKVSPELERIIVQASRDDDRGTGYSDVFYHALAVHQSKREPTVTRLIELLSTEDPVNVGGRVLWGLQQGVEPDQRPRVAAAAIRVLSTRADGYMRRQAFRCAHQYGTKQDVPAIRELLEKPGVTGEFRDECLKLLAAVETRE